MTPLANHLWQSTLFLALAGLMALACRHNRASVRYGIWFAASVKFLVPFAALIALGNQMSWRASGEAADTAIALVFDMVSQPFSQPAVAAAAPAFAVPGRIVATLLGAVSILWIVGFTGLLVAWGVRWRQLARAVRQAERVEHGRVFDILSGLDPGTLTLRSSDTSLEPGVFGIRRPVLVWPESITGRLSDEQIQAILVHELAHVRRHDNLAAALHMVVQSVFWFHPMVWWLGVRLIDERERACDEEVIRLGTAPRVYAESILKTCAFCVESPLACVAGVTGSDLKRRVEQIMGRDVGVALSLWRKAALATAAAVAVAGPLVVGVLSARGLRAESITIDAAGPTFEVVSVKPSGPGSGLNGSRFFLGGQFVANNVTLRMLISNAYGGPLQPLLAGQLAGGPDWLDSERFDILAKAEAGLPLGPNGPLPFMMRHMLANRFKLVVHHEVREQPIFALMTARNDRRVGPQMTSAAIDCSIERGRGAPPAPLQPGARPVCGIRFLRGSIAAGGVTMAQLANALTRIAGRTVVDMTGLRGGFDLDLQWTPDGPASADLNTPALFTAMQEQLGLTLDPQRGQVDVLVIDRAERPTADDFESVSIPAPPPPPPAPPPMLPPPPPPGL